MIRKAFVVTGIASAMNGADGHRVRSDDELEFCDSDDDFDGFGLLLRM